MKKISLLFLLTINTGAGCLMAQNVGINATGALPDPKAMLDISSTSSGLLIPRMTTAQRDAISSPPVGLQVFNLTTNTLDLYKAGRWEAVTLTAPTTNLVYVYSLADLPAPVGNAITLDATKMYVFSGIVNISPNYLNLNGANLRGTDPGKDGVLSTVSGAVLRSTAVSVFMANMVVLPASGSTKAYDFADATGSKYCNLFSGCSVVEAGVPSLGVGLVSGFQAITIAQNYWNCQDGLKVAGNVGKFCSTTNFIVGITAGAGIEFMPSLVINDIDLSNNYFIYAGQTGVKVNAGATIDRGRMTTNMFRGVSTYISGFDSYTPAWEMRQNTYIPNTRALASVYLNNNTTPTALSTVGTFYKIAGATTTVKQQRFVSTANRLTYTGKEGITAKVLIVAGAKSPATSSDFSIAIAKNGTVIPNPNGSMAAATNNQSFQVTLTTELDMVTGDYVEAFLRTNNGNATSLVVEELQFRVTD
ncbi:hypothetical protein [Hymenobacter terricola]|uniref:hypothetical protein n=1 Tax=Hymenobacter terricola TaxID=2819236 RepID=UPI001B317AB2|nr:hypothetical protein [Hymenobacter terricola]